MDGERWQAWWRSHGEPELRCILMPAWDPVGVCDTPEAWDEYDRYAPEIARQMREATDAERTQAAIADHLTRTEAYIMGTVSERRVKANRYLASALVAWHE